MFLIGRQTNIADTGFITISSDLKIDHLSDLSHLCLFNCLSWQIHGPTLGIKPSFYLCRSRNLIIPDFKHLRCMEKCEADQSWRAERPSPPSSSSPSPPASILKQSTTPVSVTPIQTNNPTMQFPNSASQANASLIPWSITKVPSNTSLERVISTSKMAALQSRRCSGSSLANLRSSLKAEDNPRRGSALGWCVNAW